MHQRDEPWSHLSLWMKTRSRYCETVWFTLNRQRRGRRAGNDNAHRSEFIFRVCFWVAMLQAETVNFITKLFQRVPASEMKIMLPGQKRRSGFNGKAWRHSTTICASVFEPRTWCFISFCLKLNVGASVFAPFDPTDATRLKQDFKEEMEVAPNFLLPTSDRPWFYRDPLFYRKGYKLHVP